MSHENRNVNTEVQEPLIDKTDKKIESPSENSKVDYETNNLSKQNANEMEKKRTKSTYCFYRSVLNFSQKTCFYQVQCH